MTVTKRMFNFDGDAIECTVHKSKRVRTSEIRVDEDSVMIRTPSYGIFPLDQKASLAVEGNLQSQISLNLKADYSYILPTRS